MCRAFSLVPALEHEFFTLENPAHRVRTLRNEHVLALLEEESPREVNETKRKKKKWWGNGTERERKRIIFTSRSRQICSIEKHRWQLESLIEFRSLNKHLKFRTNSTSNLNRGLIESKMFPSCARVTLARRSAPKTYRYLLSPVSIYNFRFLKVRSNLANYTFLKARGKNRSIHSQSRKTFSVWKNVSQRWSEIGKKWLKNIKLF